MEKRRLCNALKSKHEENEAIFMRLRHVMTSKLKINTYCSKQLRETIITLRAASPQVTFTPAVTSHGENRAVMNNW
uniref:Uncharacterized protein n=1 Tax=Tanacetum cinerariifolium TaxID=118510 RepID=A0A6L2J457_TANCI|nr:hypothetical protein [Tanacetum cinerariifolium]